MLPKLQVCFCAVGAHKMRYETKAGLRRSMLPPLVMSECFSSTSRAPMWKARFSVVLAEVEVADGLIHGRLHERAADPFRALVPRPAATSCAGGRHLDDRAERWPQTPRGGSAGREVGEWIAETKQRSGSSSIPLGRPSTAGPIPATSLDIALRAGNAGVNRGALV